MMLTAWRGYEIHAWGENDLMPKAHRGRSSGIFAGHVPHYAYHITTLTIYRAKMGASIVDALDTLIIMGLEAEATKAQQWIASSLSFNHVCCITWPLNSISPPYRAPRCRCWSSTSAL